jgi:3-oxoacyl-[acyl-carrier-protein] synthase-3
MIYAKINGTGSYLPDRVLKNDDLASELDTSDEWIQSRTGIASRHIASSKETTSYMAIQAAKNALESSSIQAQDIDMILGATCTPDKFFPSIACHVQHALGIEKPIPSFDISAACSGFMYMIDVANQYIQSGKAKNILLVGSEVMSKAVNWKDRSTCVLFGDGAGAAILSASDKPGMLGSHIHAAFDHKNFLTYSNYAFHPEDTTIHMSGNEVFKLAVNIMNDIVDEILELTHIKKEDIDWLIPHQANIRIIQALAKKLDLPMSRVVTTIEEQGNTSAASIPLALDYAIKTDKVQRGQTILLESFGAGLTWGAAVFQYI